MRNVDNYKDKLIRMANDHSYVYVSDEVKGCGGDEQFVKFLRNVASSDFIKWLYKDYKFKLNKWEYSILKYLAEDTKYRYVARDKSNCVYVYENKPMKTDDCWNIYLADGKYELLYCLSNLFQFVRWEDDEPKMIEEILDNCEVKDSD